MLRRLLLVTVLAAACSTPPQNTPGPQPVTDTDTEGKSEFETATTGNNGGPSRSGAESDGDMAAGAGNESPTAGNDAATSPERLIEESDIYKVVGNTLYVLNRYRGLQVIDITNLDAPKVLGKAPIYGWPRDMYIRDNTAYVIVSDYYYYWRGLDDGLDANGFHGSQLRVVDLSTATNPRVVGQIDIQGDVTDSRIVGNVLYLVSHRYSWWYDYNSSDDVNKTVVLSVNVTDPETPTVIDSEDFPQGGWEQHINVTNHSLYVSSTGWQENGYTTNVRYVDISDPAGDIRTRGAFTVPGRVQDRWSLDEYDGYVRVASGQSWGNGDVFLTTWNVANPDAITPGGKYTLHVNESLTATRFDGTRGYLVSYRSIDPLFAFDLTDPLHPRLEGELEMTGWLDFMVPMGDRIVALGHDDVTAANGERSISLAVSLIDSTSGQAPQLLSRVGVGADWGWVPSSRDDMAKVFKVLGPQGLIVFPFQSWSRNDWRMIGGVQLIDYSRDALTKRGLIKDCGWVERGVPHQDDTVLTISSEIFQTIDITNRDQPRVRGRLELARNVQDFAILPNGQSVQLSGDWYSGDAKLSVTPKFDPDAATPTSSVHVPAPYGRMFVNGNLAYVASVPDDATGNRHTRIEVVDLTNPASPVTRGTVDLPEEIWTGYRSWYWGYGDEVKLVGGTTLVFHRYSYGYWRGCYGCEDGNTTTPEHKLYFVDLSNPDAPRVASQVNVAADWAWGLNVTGNTVYLSEYDNYQRGSNWYNRYYLHRIDIANVDAPVVLPKVNIPGQFVGASTTSNHIYTLESAWDQTAQVSRTQLHALAILNDRAYLRSSVELKGWLNNVIIDGNTAYTSTQWSETTGTGQAQRWQSHVQLVTVDLTNARDVKVLAARDLPTQYAWLQKVQDGMAYFGAYYGLFAYDVTAPADPRFEAFFRTEGWSTDLVVDGRRLFVPSGYYGVQMFDLPVHPN